MLTDSRMRARNDASSRVKPRSSNASDRKARTAFSERATVTAARGSMVAQTRIALSSSKVLSSRLSLASRQNPAERIRRARHGSVDQASYALGAEGLRNRSEIIFEIGEMIVEAAGRNAEPGGERRQLQPGDAILAQHVLAGAHPVAATEPAIARAALHLRPARAVAKRRGSLQRCRICHPGVSVSRAAGFANRFYPLASSCGRRQGEAVDGLHTVSYVVVGRVGAGMQEPETVASPANYPCLSLGQILRRSVRLRGTALAVADDECELSWSQLALRVAKLAGALKALGLMPGGRVAILAENSHRYLETLFAVPSAGGVVTPLNFRLAAPELARILGDCGAEILLVDEAHRPLAAELTAVVRSTTSSRQARSRQETRRLPSAGALRDARTGSRPGRRRRTRRRRPRRPLLHQRQHRRAEGRDAQPC